MFKVIRWAITLAAGVSAILTSPEPLFAAAVGGNAKAVKLLLNYHADLKDDDVSVDF